MDTPAPTPQPHSAEYFGDDRDHWWDPEFVALILRSWGLGEVRRVLDIGCGVGHWGRVLLPHLPPDATVVGVDRELEWVAKAQAIASTKGIADRTTYVQGDAGDLPVADGVFDLVTCQTVLIHVPDCRAVIREMLRVLRPGGCVLVAEPNNMVASQIVASTRFDEPIEQRLAMTRFQLVCERGKAALGEGNNSVGELLPGIFAELGLRGVRVCQSNRAMAMIPPYASAAEQALRDQAIDWAQRDFWIWSKPDTRRYFHAGGGTDADFETLWQLAMSLSSREADALRGATYHSAGGGVCYLVAGWKA
jgi:SAM-dependent methyltransferase